MTKLEARIPNEARMSGNDELGHSDFNRHSAFEFRAWYDSAFVAPMSDSGRDRELDSRAGLHDHITMLAAIAKRRLSR